MTWLAVCGSLWSYDHASSTAEAKADASDSPASSWWNMNEPPVQFESISEFKGMVSDTEAQPPETLKRQLNLMSVTSGSLTTRGGLKEVTLDLLE